MKHNSPAFLLKCALVLAVLTATAAKPDWAPENNVYANGRIIDISHQIRAGMPGYGDTKFLGKNDFLEYLNPFGDGKVKTQDNRFRIPAHAGTHVDAPSHALAKWEWAGYGVDTLDLETLNGPGLLVDIPRDKNITAEVLQSLNLPKGLRRVLFRTANTDRRLMWKAFESNYTGVTLDGAEWIVKNTDIKLIGIDYISVAIGSKTRDFFPPHKVLLENRDIIPLEALNLGNVPAGDYYIHCLPMRLLGADGSPTRCILMK